MSRNFGRTTLPRQRHVRPRVEALEDRTLPSATVVEVEPNNKKGQATTFAVPADGLVQLQGESAGKADKDFFRFTVLANGRATANVASPNGQRVQMTIEDNFGNKVFETEPNDGVNSGAFNYRAGRTYFVRLRAKGNASAEYLADLALGAGTGGGGGGGGGGGSQVTESENNDKKGLADVFAFDAGGQARLLGTSQNKDDKDFFVFIAPASGNVSVTVSAPNGTFAQLEVEDAAGNSIFETEPNDGVNDGGFAVVAGFKYFVRLRSKTSAPAAYQVDLNLT